MRLRQKQLLQISRLFDFEPRDCWKQRGVEVVVEGPTKYLFVLSTNQNQVAVNKDLIT